MIQWKKLPQYQQQSIPSQAKTVLAPNAVSHYNNQMMHSAMKVLIKHWLSVVIDVQFNLLQASLLSSTKKKPVIVVKENGADTEADDDELALDQLIEERDSLYKKSLETKGAHMQVRWFLPFW